MNREVSSMYVLKAVAALSVIGIHVTAGYSSVCDFGYVLNQLFRFAVPIFVILSGFLLYNADLFKKRDTKKFYVGRFKKVIIPFFIWTMVYSIWSFKSNPSQVLSILLFERFHRYIVNGYVHLYFVIIIAQMYLIYPLLRKLFKRGYSKLVLFISFSITLYFNMAIYLYSLHIIIAPLWIYKYIYKLFFTWIFYFVVGMYISMNRDRFESLIKKYDNVLVIVWFLSFLLLLTDSKITNTQGSSMKLTVIIYTIISFCALYRISLKIKTDSSTMKIFKNLSDKSYIVFLSHVLILDIIKVYAVNIKFTNILNGIWGMIILYVLTVSSTYIFVKIIDYIPYSQLLGNVRIRNKSNEQIKSLS